jgi:hypothetical protein
MGRLSDTQILIALNAGTAVLCAIVLAALSATPALAR